MTILVNGEAKELEAIGKNGIEWTQDLLGNHDALHYDDEQDAYIMGEDDFAWWEPVVYMLNEINDLEGKLTEEARAEYEAEHWSIDLDSECEERLEWLKNHAE